MSLTTIGDILLFANAIAHLLQYFQINADPNVAQSDKMGVLAFTIINAVVGVLVLIGFGWARWAAFIFPLLGGLGLAATFRNSAGSKAISALIIVLDLALVVLFGYLLFA